MEVPVDGVRPLDQKHTTPSPIRRFATQILRFPLFHKIFLANLGLLILGVGTGIVLVRNLSPATSAPTMLLIGSLLACTVLAILSLVHAYLIRAALYPLRTLEEAAQKVEAGDPSARAVESRLADRNMARVVRVFNDMLDTQAALRQKERAQSVRSLKSQELERLKTSRELYDHLAQTLAGVLVRLRAIATDHSNEADAAALEEVRKEVLSALERARHVARRLHPPELGDLGLPAAVEAYARTVAESSDLPVTVRVVGPLPPLEAEVSLAAFRIVQEALQNSAQHANATRADVYVTVVSGELRVEIADNGRGFNATEAIATKSGLGISSMLDRAGHWGGSLSIESRAGEGARICLMIPISTHQGQARQPT